jgi:hypothetical protein
MRKIHPMLIRCANRPFFFAPQKKEVVFILSFWMNLPVVPKQCRRFLQSVGYF